MDLRTIIKIIRRNRLPFLALTISFAFLLAAIMYGGRLIYTMEANTLRSEITGYLDRDIVTVQNFFSSCARDLQFIKNIPGLTECLASGGDSSGTKGRAKQMLLMFARSHPHFPRIRLLDGKGMERLSMLNSDESGPHIILASLLRDRAGADYYLKSADLARGGVYASFFDTDRESEKSVSEYTEPAITLVSHLSGPAGPDAGTLVMDISIKELLGQLSTGAFFQDESGRLIISGRDGRLLRQLSPYELKGASGTIPLSDTESVAYAAVEYLPGFKVWMARQFSSSAVKGSILKLEIVSVSIMIIFFFTVLVLGVLNLRHFKNVDVAQKAIIHSLANLSEWRDSETGTHLERTRNFSVLLARTLRKKPKFGKVITDEFVEALYDAVPLHDIGKVAIRDDILLKSSRLSFEEFDIMKSHVVVGRDIIRDIIVRFRLESEFLKVSQNICYFHHEKYDGSGYPESLHGEDIPLEARIFAICDVYDALRAKRPYKPGLSHEEAVETILPDKGKHFDPDVVDAFMECSDKFYEIFEIYKLFDNTYGKLMNVRSSDALKIEWSERLSVGNQLIDSQHMEFISRVNALFSAVLLGEGKKEALRELEFLHDYALHHFGTEEDLMRRHEVPDYSSHKFEHVVFVRNLLAIRDEVKRTDDISSDLVVEINAKVVNWLMTHIIKIDKKMAGNIKQHSEAAINDR